MSLCWVRTDSPPSAYVFAIVQCLQGWAKASALFLKPCHCEDKRTHYSSGSICPVDSARAVQRAAFLCTSGFGFHPGLVGRDVALRFSLALPSARPRCSPERPVPFNILNTRRRARCRWFSGYGGRGQVPNIPYPFRNRVLYGLPAR